MRYKCWEVGGKTVYIHILSLISKFGGKIR